MKNSEKIINVLKIAGITYAIATFMVTMVYLIDGLFPNDGPYPHMRDILGGVVKAMWSYPIVTSLFGGAIIFATLLKEMKGINRIEKVWSVPPWIANLIIGVLAIFPGGLILGFMSKIGQSLPAGPWNFFIACIVGIIFLSIFHEILSRVAKDKLQFFAKKCFG